MDRLAVSGELVVRQMWMKIERRDVVEEAELVEVPERRERRDLLRAFDERLDAVRTVLCTGTSSAFISERVYWPKRCWRGTSASP